MTARPLSLSTCPVLPLVLNCPSSQGFPEMALTAEHKIQGVWLYLDQLG